MVKGYDSDAKIRVVLYCLDRVFDRRIIRTSSMSDIPNFINRAFEERLLPDTVKSTTAYDLGRMTVHINSYVTSTKFNPKGNNSTFTLFFPVQSVLSNPKRYNNFLTELESTKSRKVMSGA